MMICVQLDKQAEFDKLWRWAKKYMLYTSGKWSGYYAWHCTPHGVKIGKEPSCASDGEIYFITSLFFASHRWGNDGVYDYNQEAQKILKDVMSKMVPKAFITCSILRVNSLHLYRKRSIITIRTLLIICLLSLNFGLCGLTLIRNSGSRRLMQLVACWLMHRIKDGIVS